MKTTHWLAAVHDKILREILQLPTPEAQLCEALLWRGFLAHQDGGLIRLVRVAEKPDAADIASLGAIAGVAVKPIADPKWCAEIEWACATSEGRENAIRSILELASPNGITGVGVHPNFSRHFPAAELDQGVALLARGMMRLGLHTIISGHGTEQQCELCIEHENHPLGTEFRSRFDAQWGNQMRNPEGVSFQPGSFGGTKLEFGAGTDDVAEAYAQFDAAKELGRAIHSDPRSCLTLVSPILSLAEMKRKAIESLAE
jgi:hypothetical protein